MAFSNILLVLDTRLPGRMQAVRHAVEFARSEGASLTVCCMVNWAVPEIRRYMTYGTVRILTDVIRDKRIKRLNELIASIDDSDLDIAVNVLIGKPHIEIARVVNENQYDLVIKPFTDRSVLPFVSSVQDDRELIRSCPAPVWLLNVAQQNDRNCILAALDVPSAGDLVPGLNAQIVQISRSIALAESRPLHFVHVWNLRGEGHMRALRSPATDLEVDRRLAGEESRRKTWLQKTVATPSADLSGDAHEAIVPRLHVIKGHAKKVIPDLAENLGAELIVVGARKGASGILRKTIAEQILPRTDCSLLLVPHPAAALSPVSRAIPTLQVV